MILLIYFGLINVTAFAVFGYDKRKAQRREWRVPEKTLFALAAVGGSVGALAGMYVFRHKTKHWKFKIGIPAIIAAQAAAWYMILERVF